MGPVCLRCRSFLGLADLQQHAAAEAQEHAGDERLEWAGGRQPGEAHDLPDDDTGSTGNGYYVENMVRSAQDRAGEAGHAHRKRQQQHRVRNAPTEDEKDTNTSGGSQKGVSQPGTGKVMARQYFLLSGTELDRPPRKGWRSA